VCSAMRKRRVWSIRGFYVRYESEKGKQKGGVGVGEKSLFTTHHDERKIFLTMPGGGKGAKMSGGEKRLPVCPGWVNFKEKEEESCPLTRPGIKTGALTGPRVRWKTEKGGCVGML